MCECRTNKKNSFQFHFLFPCFYINHHQMTFSPDWAFGKFHESKNSKIHNFHIKWQTGTVEMPKEDHGVLIISVAAVVSFLTCLLCTLCHRKRKRRHHRQLHRNANYDSTTSATGKKFSSQKLEI
jgi:hypothetical protein